MMARWSISGRLIATLTVALAALWLVGAAATAIVLHHELNEAFDDSLKETAHRLLPLAAHEVREGEIDERGLIDEFMLAPEHEEDLIYQLRAPDGQVLMRSQDAPPAPFAVPLREGFFDLEAQRFYTAAALGGAMFMQVGETSQERQEAVTEILVWLPAPLLILVPLTGLVIWWTVRQTTRPILRIQADLRARSGADLAEIHAASLPDELAPIIEDVNRLLIRLSHALETERAFAGNSAHELRTPVAAALAQAQRLQAELTDPAQQDRAAQIVATLRQLSDLVEKLLQLSRAQAGLALTRQTVDLMPVLSLLIDEQRRHSSVADRLRFDPGSRSNLVVQSDIDAFGIAFNNVLQNAVVHGPSNTAIDVSIDGDKSVRVTNGGPPVPPEIVGKLTQRFERGGTSVTGSGLGLAIADTIMRQSGGGLTIHSPAPGRTDGFAVVLSFAEA